MKKKLLLVGIIILVLSMSILLILNDNKEENNNQNNDIVYEIAFKVNPLVKFKFKYNNVSAIITDFELLNDRAKELFLDIDFKNMELNEAISLYGDTLTKNEIEFDTIHIWTTWEKVEYFKSEKYKLKVNKVDNLDSLDDLTKSKLIYNEKYYLKDDEYGYSIVFNEDGTLSYYQEKDRPLKICDDLDPDDCYETTIKAGEVETDENNIFEINGDKVKLKAASTDRKCYFGWCLSYDICEIGFNKLKCDHYNSYSGLDIKYRYTKYYEVN
ncbi:MAG: hypothetical protein NC181_04120 [Clostridium sp.]|nr:hypothetical protein [Clostridium sp.]MCM1444352.1 hypothetical protein [Candidatus Amulumruptor caecigallinarius]